MAGRTLLWVLRDAQHGATDCEAWGDDQAAHVSLRRNGKSPIVTDFANSAQAVRWAFDFERMLIADGWEKVV